MDTKADNRGKISAKKSALSQMSDMHLEDTSASCIFDELGCMGKPFITRPDESPVDEFLGETDKEANITMMGKLVHGAPASANKPP